MDNLIGEIIKDCEVLRRMTFIEPPKLKELNANFDTTGFPQFKNIIARITPLYLGIYPRDPKEGGDIFKLISLIKDADYLESGKRFYLLVLLHFYSGYHELDPILKSLNRTINTDYKSLRFFSSIKEACIASSLIDMLIFNKYTFNQHDFELACRHASLSTMQYIYGLGGIDIHNGNDHEIPFLFTCVSGDLEKAEWVYNIGLDNETRGGRKINIHGHEERPFKDACRSGNFELVKWLWNLSVYLDTMRDFLPNKERIYNRKINLSIGNEFIFQFALESGNLELIEWFWLLRVQEGDRVNILKINIDNYAGKVKNFVLERLVYI